MINTSTHIKPRNVTFLALVAGLAGLGMRATAADSVSVYGVLDGGIVRATNGKTVWRQSSGTGSTSRLGFTGREDLGGGWLASFQLESGFQSDVGTSGGTTRQGVAAYFNRESNISISGPGYGTLKLGRQYPTQLSLALDPFLGVSGFSPFASLVSSNADLGSGATIGDSRVSNAVSYETPGGGGVSARVLYAFRESTTDGFPKPSDYGIELQSKVGAFQYLGVQFTVVNTDPTSTIPSFKNYWAAVGGQYVSGANSLTYQLNVVAPQKEGYRVAQNHVFGWVYSPNARNTFKASLVYRNVAGRHASNATSLGLGYEYNFSKRTAIYTRLGIVKNSSSAVSSLAGIAPLAAGNDVSVSAVGIRTRF